MKSKFREYIESLTEKERIDICVNALYHLYELSCSRNSFHIDIWRTIISMTESNSIPYVRSEEVENIHREAAEFIRNQVNQL